MSATASPIRKIKYTPQLKITNLEQLPTGGGCKYLVALIPLDENSQHLIAKQWHRNMPKKVWSWEVVVVFGGKQ